ncbi:hypothetical protein MMC31_007534 [Peltigera leucophlebia]|nr:hypothetical protein [Peltigera leucophlebia]
MQPVIGVLADSSRSKWGRRRPFMIGGALIVGFCLLVLGWTAEIVGFFIKEPDLNRSCTIALAVISIYAVDFAINAVQSTCRSLIIDTLPIPKQQLGSAWASRMISIGSLLGYIAGTVNLVKIFGNLLGDSQFKQLTAIAALTMNLTVLVTSYAVEERVLISPIDGDAKLGALKTISKILKTTLHLPDRIQAICWVQFWAWIGIFHLAGWFPFLFYGTTWVGEVYFRYSTGASTSESTDKLGDVGRVGSLSLVIFSIITLTASVTLPWLVKSPDFERGRFTPRPPPTIAPLVTTMAKYKPDLVTAWMYSHLIFAFAMGLTPFVRSLHMATVLVSICGMYVFHLCLVLVPILVQVPLIRCGDSSWALTSWAPFTFMGIEINRLTTVPNSYRPLSDDLSTPTSSPTLLRLHHRDGEPEDSDSSTGETAGVYLGIHNLFTTLPQFVGTFISMLVFSILEPGKSELLHDVPEADAENLAAIKNAPNAISVCMFIGALSAIGAAYATKRMKRMG